MERPVHRNIEQPVVLPVGFQRALQGASKQVEFPAEKLEQAARAGLKQREVLLKKAREKEVHAMMDAFLPAMKKAMDYRKAAQLLSQQQEGGDAHQVGSSAVLPDKLIHHHRSHRHD